MDGRLFIEILGLIIAIGAMSSGFVALKHKLKTDEIERSARELNKFEAHTERMKTIEFNIKTLERDKAQITRDQSVAVDEIYEEIKDLRAKQETNMVDINRQLEKMGDEIKRRQDELKDLLGDVNNALIRVSTQFEDHEKSHTSNAARSRKRL